MTSEILKILSNTPELFSFQLYYYLNHKDTISIYTTPEAPNTFILMFKDILFEDKCYITAYGHKATIEALLKSLVLNLDHSTRYELLFQHHHLATIKYFFDDFDFIDESATHSDNINRLQAMSIEKANFVPKRHLRTGKKLTPELLEHFDPDLLLYANSGVVYGIIEDAELISVAPVPFIYKSNDYSFAIIHNFFTNEKYKRKGYATGAIRAALNFLFTRKIIKSVYLLVDEQNPAVKMLEKIGFETSSSQWLGARAFLK